MVEEKAGRDAATKTAKDKIKADAAEKRVAATEKAQALAEKKIGGVDNDAK